jgi:hypothetical protein
MVSDRGFAEKDYTAITRGQSSVVLQENSWGFGQLLPALLLILPLFSLIEGAIGMNLSYFPPKKDLKFRG